MTHKDVRLLFVSTFDYPSRFAHAIHGLEMGRAFSSVLGDSFLFLLNTAVDSGETKGVRVARLVGGAGRLVKKLRLRKVFLFPRLLYLAIRFRANILYTTDPGLYGITLLVGKILRRTVFAECHGALTASQASALARMDRVFFVTNGLRSRWLSEHRGMENKCLVLPNAVDTERFDAIADDVRTLRTDLGIPVNTFVIGYIGRFEPLGIDKGIHLMINAMKTLSSDTHLILVGGAKSEVSAYTQYTREHLTKGSVAVIGHVTGSDVPRYAKACDCLVYVPPSTEFSEIETSPMKIYEYMAANRPMIVSDTHAIREAVRDDEAEFVSPGSLASYVDGVSRIRAHLEESHERAQRAHDRIKSQTWITRAERIVQLASSVV